MNGVMVAALGIWVVTAVGTFVLRRRVVARLKAIGLHEEMGEPKMTGFFHDYLEFRLLPKTRGRVDAKDWRLFVAYTAVTFVGPILFTLAVLNELNRR